MVNTCEYGPVINTPFNEVFPIYFNNKVFFSSDRTDMGYGALDIYYASELLGFQSVNNFRAPVNSAYDDFSPAFYNDSVGYFSSNRKGGIGGDDIYAFTFSPEQVIVPITNLKIINGVVEEGRMVDIYDEKDKLLASVRVGIAGTIQVENLKSGIVYTLKVKGIDIDQESLLAVRDRYGRLAGKFPQSAKNEFIFELLQQKDYPLDKKENIVDESEIQFEVSGKLVADEKVNVKGIPVSLVASDGEVMSETATEDDGKFQLKGVDPTRKYTIQTGDVDGYHEVDIYGTSGAIVQSLTPVGRNQFAYTRQEATPSLPEGGAMVSPNVLGTIVGEVSIEGEGMNLYDESDRKIKEPVADEDGFFSMGSLTALQTYRLEVPEVELGKFDKLVVISENGDTSQTVRPFDLHSYLFQYMVYHNIDEPEEIIADYNVIIRNYELGERRFRLSSETNSRVDTVTCNANGELNLKNIDQNRPYTLALLGKETKGKLVMELLDNDGQIVLGAPIEENRYFRINFSKRNDYTIAKESLTDESVLSIGLSGHINGTAGKKEKLEIYSENDKLLGETFTSENMKFMFSEILFAGSYIIKTDMPGADRVMAVLLPGRKDSLQVKRSEDGNFYINMKNPNKKAITLADGANKDIEVSEGDKFSLPMVFFSFNSFFLTEESKELLKPLASLLKNNSHLRIQIYAHTDSRGAKNYNALLSQRRADAVLDYLVSKGIDPGRLSSKGLGELELTNKCADNVPCSNTEHAANRRTEFEIMPLAQE